MNPRSDTITAFWSGTAYGLADRKVILPGLQRCTLDQSEQLRWLQDIAADLARTL